MNKYKLRIIAMASLFILSGCVKTETEVVQLTYINSKIEGYEFLNKGEWEAALNYFETNIRKQGDDSDLSSLLGMARAQIGTGEFEAAKETLLLSVQKYPESISALEYLGAVYTELEDYSQATDCYMNIVNLGDESLTIQTRLLDCLWRAADNSKIYSVSIDLYKRFPEQSRYLNNLLWAGSISGIDTNISEIFELIKGTEYEETIHAMYSAYLAAKEGRYDLAEEMLFNIELKDSLKFDVDLKLGDCNADKQGEGVGVAFQRVFNSRGVIIGEWKNSEWNGYCYAWFGASGETMRKYDGVEYKGIYYRNSIFSGNWQEGIPEGAVELKMMYYNVFVGNESENSAYCEVTNLNLIDGKVIGRTEALRYDGNYSNQGIFERWDEEPWQTIWHEFVAGKAVPFEIETQDGLKEVYEARKTIYNGRISYQEVNCGHSYIWN